MVAALAKGQKKKARYAQARYLQSFAARLIAVRKTYRAQEHGKRPALSDLPLIARKLCAWQGSDEKVKVNYQLKTNGSGDRRITMNFGFENRALQRLVSRALEPFAELDKNQFATKGGVPAAIATVTDALQSGYRYGYEVDIVNCYPSLGGVGGTNLLPLPQSVTERVVISRELNLSPGNIKEWVGRKFLDDAIVDTITEARLGIPQGSSVSPLVADILLRWVIGKVQTHGVIVTYADNFLLMSKTKEEAESMLLALRAALTGHPGGSLTPKNPVYFRPGIPLSFLGHVLVMKNGKYVAIPNEENFYKFAGKFERLHGNILKSAHSKKSLRKASARIARYTNGWTNSFSNWPGVEDNIKICCTLLSTIKCITVNNKGKSMQITLKK